MSTPSETGSQDSVEGATVGRYVSPLYLYQPEYPYHLITFQPKPFRLQKHYYMLFSNIITTELISSNLPLHYHTTVQNTAYFVRH